MKKIWMSWSSGKDGAFALTELRKSPGVEVVGLFTTINESVDRVTMHGVRASLVHRQAEEIGLPLHMVNLPAPCPNEIYAEKMTEIMNAAIKQHVTHFAFGDLFLEDVRQYRESLFKAASLRPLFPIWKRDTRSLAEEMIAIGQKAIITCVDLKKLRIDFAGREFDQSFLQDLPEDVDPCGENGEFHTFVYASPLFKHPIRVRRGETVTRDGFAFADVLAM